MLDKSWTKTGTLKGQKMGRNWTKPADAGRKNDSAKTKRDKSNPSLRSKRNTGRENFQEPDCYRFRKRENTGI